MRLNLFVNPQRTSHSTLQGWLSARSSEDCDEIAKLLTNAGAGPVGVFEEPVAVASDSDFFLVFEADIDWHRSAISATGRSLDTSRWVILRPSRDLAPELAQRLAPAALVFYVGGGAWAQTTRTAVVARREIVEPLGWKVGPSLMFFRVTDGYGALVDDTHTTLAGLVVDYLRAVLTVNAKRS